MSSNAIDGQLTKLYVADIGSPQVYSAIPEIRSIGGPDGQSNLIDVTDLDSTGKEFRPGLKDEGSLQLEMMYIPENAVHASLRDAWSDRTKKQFRLQFTDSGATYWDFQGYVTAFQSRLAVDEVVMATVTIKITGAITEGS